MVNLQHQPGPAMLTIRIKSRRTDPTTIQKSYRTPSPDDEPLLSESDSELKQPPRKKARNDSDSQDHGRDVRLSMPALGTRPTSTRNSTRIVESKKEKKEKEKEKDPVNNSSTGPLHEAISMQRKHAQLLEEADADLQKKDARIDALQAENARLKEDWNESKRVAANVIHQVLQLRKAKEDLMQENKELEKHAKAGNELVQTKEILEEVRHEAMEWKAKKEKLENRVKILEATIAEYAKFVAGVKTGLPGLERSLNSVPGEVCA
ncbi:hypothetical protein VNI00_016285 [Paramarasmius palmivorus]|uniref:Uncharacterized protein n=1 Tax=Paramarasmius palmivorus TaxID=297713 RepID=A0AAW0BEQ5_9AGAR